MTTSTFNGNANPITDFFMKTLENYIYTGEDITDQINAAADLIHVGSKTMPTDGYQTELMDTHHFLIQAMDDYLNDLNYFKYLGKFERMKILRQQKSNLDLQHPSIKILDDDAAMEEEIRDVIGDIFDCLDIIRAAMSENTIAEMLNLNSAADEFTEEIGIGRFLERDDMDDRMEFTFWLQLSRRLNFYDLSEQMKDYLDEQETNGREKLEMIKARLRGQEQEMFPAHLCTLDAFEDDDIEMAKNEIAEEDAQDAENELNGNSDDPEDDITDIFDYRDEGDASEPSNNNATNNGKGATIIPLSFFRKKKEKDQPDPPKP